MSSVKATHTDSAKVRHGRLSDMPETIKLPEDSISKILHPGVQKALAYTLKGRSKSLPQTDTQVAAKPHHNKNKKINRGSPSVGYNYTAGNRYGAPFLTQGDAKRIVIAQQRRASAKAQQASHQVSPKEKTTQKTDPNAEKELRHLIAGFISERSHKKHAVLTRRGHLGHAAQGYKQVRVEAGHAERIGDFPSEKSDRKIASR